MNNLSFSSKFSPQRDNGERTLCWRHGKPNQSGAWLLTIKDVPDTMIGLYDKEDDLCSIQGEIIAYMKLPTPYKPD